MDYEISKCGVAGSTKTVMILALNWCFKFSRAAAEP